MILYMEMQIYVIDVDLYYLLVTDIRKSGTILIDTLSTLNED